MAYDYRVQKAPVYIERINKRKTANNRLLCAFTSPPPTSLHHYPLPSQTIKTRKNVQKGKENGKSIFIYLVQTFRRTSPQK